jgi:hypothetical protein
MTTMTKATLRTALEAKGIKLSNNEFKKLKKAELQEMLDKQPVSASASVTVTVGDLPMTKDRMTIPDPLVVEKSPIMGGSVFVESKAVNILKERGFTTVKHPDFKRICAAVRNYYGTHYPGRVNVYHVRPLDYKGILCALVILQEYGTSRYCAVGANLKYSNGKYSVTNIKTVKC